MRIASFQRFAQKKPLAAGLAADFSRFSRTLRPRQVGRHFVDDNFNFNFPVWKLSIHMRHWWWTVDHDEQGVCVTAAFRDR